jgi:hypothetical protein
MRSSLLFSLLLLFFLVSLFRRGRAWFPTVPFLFRASFPLRMYLRSIWRASETVSEPSVLRIRLRQKQKPGTECFLELRRPPILPDDSSKGLPCQSRANRTTRGITHDACQEGPFPCVVSQVRFSIKRSLLFIPSIASIDPIDQISVFENEIRSF